MINLENFIKALKITWFRRLIKQKNSPLYNLFESTIIPIDKLTIFGYQYIDLKLPKIKNKFWHDALLSWTYMCKQIEPKNYLELCQLPIWYNPSISKHPLFLPELYNKGINLIGDVLDDNGQIFTREELINRTRLNTLNPLNYLRLKIGITPLLLKNALQPYRIHKPMAPLNLIILTKSEKGSKDFYTILQEPFDLITHTKWNHILNRDIPNQTWKLVHKVCFNTVKDNYLIHLQFKIINQILGTKDLLNKMSITDNPKCNFCKDLNETIAHLFFDCELVHLLWETLYNWIYNKLKIRIPLDKPNIILGNIDLNPNSQAINTLNMITKSYIFYCSRGKQQLNIYHLQNRIESTFYTLEFIARKNEKIHHFNRIWNNFKQLFNED